MGCRGDAGGAMDVEADVVVAAPLSIARVHSHPDENRHPDGPLGSCKRPLGLDRGSGRLRCVAEDHQKGVALRAVFDATVGSERGTHEPLMRLEHFSVRGTQILNETCRAFDVCEEEGDVPVGSCAIVQAMLRDRRCPALSPCEAFVGRPDGGR